MTHPFEITAGDVGQLRDDDSLFAKFVCELAEFEAARLGLPKWRVKYSRNESANDGGIDIRIDATGFEGSEFLPGGVSIWQCKAGTFQPKQLGEELNKEDVRDEIAAGATYVLAQTADFTAGMVQNRRKKVEEVTPGTEFRPLGAKEIADWASSHPLALRRFDRSRGELEFADEWLDRQMLHRITYHWTAKTEEIRDALLEWAEADGQSRVIRLYGRPGVGKSRLALETFRKHHVAPIYASKIAESERQFLGQIRHRADMSGILILDECDDEMTEFLSHWVQMAEGDFRVIAIGPDRVPGLVDHFQVERMTREELQKFVASTYPQLTPSERDWIAGLVDGYVRLARGVAEQLVKAEPGTPLMDMNLSEIVGRLIPESHMKVMTALSLQTAVGWAHELAEEGQALCKHMGIDNWAEARRLAAEMEDVGYVSDAGRMRYVTPELLAVWLAAREWQVNGELLLKLRNNLSAPAQNRFDARLGTMAGVEGAEEFVQEVLTGSGPFRDLGVLDDADNARQFFELARVSPDAALAALQRILGPTSAGQLLSFRSGRRYTVFALERLVTARQRFPLAATLLLRLAASENEPYANNATGIFCGLFNPISGSTEATGEERLDFLTEGIKNPHIEEVLTVVSSLKKALDFGRSGGLVDQSQGVKSRPFWQARSHDERRSYRIEALQLLRRAMTDGRPRVRKAALSVFFERFDVLFRAGLGDAVLDIAESTTLAESEQRTLWNNAAHVLRLAETEASLTDLQIARLQQLQHDIFGDSLGDRLRRELGPQSEVLRGRTTEGRSRRIGDLVEAALAQPDELLHEIPWLASAEATFAYGFASSLGERDDARRWQQHFFAASRKTGNPHLAAGYLVGLQEATIVSHIEVEATLDEWARDRATASFVVSVTAALGMTQQRAERLLTMLDNEWLSAAQLVPLVMANPNADLALPTVVELISRMFTDNSPIASSAWMIARRAYERDTASDWRSDAAAVSALLNLVTCDAALPSGYRDSFEDFTWGQCANLLLPEQAVPIATAIISAVTTREMMLPEDGEVGRVLKACIRSEPMSTWPALAEAIVTAQGWGGQELANWAAIVRLTDVVPLSFLRDWVGSPAVGREGRAMLLGRLTNFGRELTPLMRWLIDEYGAQSKVAERLMVDTGVRVWFGSATAAEQPRVAALERLDMEKSPQVRRWAEVFLESIRTFTARLDEATDEARFQ